MKGSGQILLAHKSPSAKPRPAPHRESVARVSSRQPRVSWNKPLRNRERPSKAECARSNLKSRRRLLAFVLAAVHQQGDLAYQFQFKAIFVGNLLGAAQILNISLQDAVQHVV